MKRRLYCESYNHATQRYTTDEITNLEPESNLGKFFFPSGKKGEFGSLLRMHLSYSNGDSREYYVVGS